MTTSTPSVLTPEVKKRLYVFAKKLAKKNESDEARLTDVEKRLKILEKQFLNSKKN